ncbi:MAG: hypothetical protein JW797_18305 [Bradymonadales bacterium]|nr:hypothetical protein [Bradymonadales bacterium]
MATGIKDKVAIVGMGCTRFGERWGDSAEDLVVEAYLEALADAGIDESRLEAYWLATCFDEINLGKSAIGLSQCLKLPFLPVTRVENFCASGTEAFRGAAYAVAAGACDFAVAVGVEKLKDTGYGGLPDFGISLGTRNRLTFPNLTAPGAFAQLATRYAARYGLAPEEVKRAMAHVSAKSHKNGAKNPKAHLRREVTIEAIMAAPTVAWPLGLFDCCGVSDGAAVAILTRPDLAREIRPDPVLVKALQIAVTSGEELMATGWDGAHIETTSRAAARAYQEAGVENPRAELSLLNLHDCFSITELVTYEDLQISPRGGAPRDILDGFYDLDGTIPCQTDGGLKCFGHPIGASGLRMIYEIYKQFQGKAQERQLTDPRLGLTHNLGGFPSMSVCSVAIFGR